MIGNKEDWLFYRGKKKLNVMRRIVVFIDLFVSCQVNNDFFSETPMPHGACRIEVDDNT